jgi:hypothetical protein
LNIFIVALDIFVIIATLETHMLTPTSVNRDRFSWLLFSFFWSHPEFWLPVLRGCGGFCLSDEWLLFLLAPWLSRSRLFVSLWHNIHVMTEIVHKHLEPGVLLHPAVDLCVRGSFQVVPFPCCL